MEVSTQLSMYIKTSANGKESNVNRALGGSTYPS